MKRLLRHIDAVFAHKSHPWARLWKWARKGSPMKRWHALERWTDHHRKWARRHHRYARARFWAAKHTIYLRKWRKARKRHRRHGTTDWEPWMNNGCPTNTTAAVKAEIAVAVVGFGLTVTATTNGTHTSTSLHYPWNNGDNLGHALDCGGARMSEFQSARILHSPGPGHYQEFFGPQDSVCAKNGTRISISGALAVQHDTHDHDAPY